MVVIEEVFIVGYYKIQTMSRQTVLQTMKMGEKKRGCSTFGHSNDLQAFRLQGGGNIPMWEATDKVVPWFYGALHYCDGHTQLRRSEGPSHLLSLLQRHP